MKLLAQKMNLKTKEKAVVFAGVSRFLDELNLTAVSWNMEKPWGGYFVIDEAQAEQFWKIFFKEIDFPSVGQYGKLSPKILVVAPQMRLSWQYHFRRAELWKAVAGRVSVVTSDSDEEKESMVLSPGQTIYLEQGERHRLVGLEEWGVVAEIWQHTDASNPSDEEDIVRVQDDFGR
jgi:mannose-6-phosphate isomerase-like protein (cupin superfamily)